MRPITEFEVAVLLATSLAAKRRPAELAEIVAATDLIQAATPGAAQLGAALRRLAAMGLLAATAGGLTLTPDGQALMHGQPRKADMAERLLVLKGKLAGFGGAGEPAAIPVTEAELEAALQTHKTTRKAPGRNLLMPKPKVDRHFKVDGHWRRAPAKRGRTV